MLGRSKQKARLVSRAFLFPFTASSTVFFCLVHALFGAFANIVVLGVFRLLFMRRRSGLTAHAVLSWAAFTHRNLPLPCR